MAVLKFLWLAIRPISKAESTYGWWELMNILPPVVYFIIPKLRLWTSDFDFIWFASIPALLFLIAGIKLQYKLSNIGNTYRYALSLSDDFDPDWLGNSLTLYIELSNAINKAVWCELLADKTYIEIEENCIYLERNISEVIPALKSTKIALPNINSPQSYPCQGKLHFELLYGYPSKPLFRQIKEYGLTFNVTYSPQKQMLIRGHSTIDNDEPFKKRDFDKEGYQI